MALYLIIVLCLFAGTVLTFYAATWEMGIFNPIVALAIACAKATLVILFFFGRDVFRVLGRQHFWRLILWSAMTASVVAVVVQILLGAMGLGTRFPFWIMQGSSMLLTILVAAFATLYRNATILLMFVIPIQARW